jgi:hypothetical protein
VTQWVSRTLRAEDQARGQTVPNGRGQVARGIRGGVVAERRRLVCARRRERVLVESDDELEALYLLDRDGEFARWLSHSPTLSEW